MPRYSYVIAFPVLIALCIGINIKRYPVVSTMLQGKAPESRWLGRSEIFQFRDASHSENASYQGARPGDAERESFATASREPIPLSGSRRSGTSDVSSTDLSSDVSSSHASSYSDSITGGFRSTSLHRPSEAPDRYGSSYDDNASEYSYDSLHDDASEYLNDYGNYVSPDANESLRTTADYENIPSSSVTATSSSSSDASTPNWSVGHDNSSQNESQPSPYSVSYPSGHGSYQTDTPTPGYSNAFVPGSTSTTDNTETRPSQPLAEQARPIQATASTSETVRPEKERPREFTLQEKLELRLGSPFSLAPSASETRNSGQYIPPDFLPAHENGNIDRLVIPEAEAPTSINVAFDIPNIPSDQPESTPSESSQPDEEAETAETE